jgi:hypothetical protein
MMRTLFLALALTMAFAGRAQAQERAAAPAARPVPQAVVDAVAQSARSRGGRKATPAVRASAATAPRRAHAPRIKRPAAQN